MPAKLIETMREAKEVVAVSSDELLTIITKVLSENAKAVSDYKAGKQQSAMFLMGLVRRQLPKADTKLILDALSKELNKS
jgi:aspartyl-tRNA(Asn)/glutamyl-tRNA(Gln) amidotransferase subunit B